MALRGEVLAQEIGRINRPPAAQYDGKRKLLLVPLMNIPPTEELEAAAITEKYWEQVRVQVSALENTLGGLDHIYHESLAEGGDDGLSQLEMMGHPSHTLVRDKCQAGASLEPTESMDLLLETMDLQRCLMLPLASPEVGNKLSEWFGETNSKRYDYIAVQIGDTLGENQTGLLFIGERHQVQFPHDVEVFYVSPPALDEFRRWLQGWLQRQQASPERDIPTNIADADHDGEPDR